MSPSFTDLRPGKKPLVVKVNNAKNAKISISNLIKKKIEPLYKEGYSYVGLTVDYTKRFQDKKSTAHAAATHVYYVKLKFHGNTIEDTRTEMLQELENHYMTDTSVDNEIKSGYYARDRCEYYIYFIANIN